MSQRLTEFPAVTAQITPKSPEYASNVEKWAPVMVEFERILDQSSSQGSEKSKARHVSRGQLLGELCLKQISLYTRFAKLSPRQLEIVLRSYLTRDRPFSNYARLLDTPMKTQLRQPVS